MSSLIEVSNLRKVYGKSIALSDVSLKMEAGQHYCIQGASGSGKSTLLYLIGGLENCTSGEIKIEGRSLFGLNDESLAKYRNSYVGFVFQFHFLLPSMNCLDNILLPARIGDTYSKKIKGHVEKLAERLQITHCLKKYPFELSGGEQQRINLVRALSLSPKLLLCDEPTGNLDSANSEKVITLLKELSNLNHATLVVVTHDNGIAGKFSNKFFLKDGALA
jgi:ABC-type lipoprotein export system ATPase subunit